DDVLDGLDDRADVGGPLRLPGWRLVRDELERPAGEAHEVEAHVDQPHVERVAVLDGPRVVGRLTGAEPSGRGVERAAAVGTLDHERATVTGPLDQAEDLGQRERVQRALKTHTSPKISGGRSPDVRCRATLGVTHTVDRT